MDAKKRKALLAAGWTIGDVAGFLQMKDQECLVLDAKVELALATRREQESKLSTNPRTALKRK